jgi:Tol biopolymer transport system component
MSSHRNNCAAIGLAALAALAACAPDPVSPPSAIAPAVPLASKQTTTSSAILFAAAAPAITGDNLDHAFSMNDDGTNIRQLTVAGGNTFPSWAPDGKRILFADGGHISVMNADGTGVTQLTFPGAACGDIFPVTLEKQVIFIRSSCTSFDLYLMNADGSGLTLLARNLDFNAPAPSPKARQVAYSSSGDIWLLDIDTGALTNLTKTGTLYFGSNLAFSPSGKRIVFSTGIHGIFVMNADGSAMTHLTFVSNDGTPRWSPDGNRIAFTRFDVQSDVFIMNADGSGITNITGSSLGPNHSAGVWAWSRN